MVFQLKFLRHFLCYVYYNLCRMNLFSPSARSTPTTNHGQKPHCSIPVRYSHLNLQSIPTWLNIQNYWGSSRRVRSEGPS
jgi:hypothetical protein